MNFERILTPKQWKLYWPEIKRTLVDCAEKGKRIHVLVEPEKVKRSTGRGSQNHHLNGHIQQIAVETGQPFEDIKRYIKQQAVGMGYPMLTRFGKPVTDLWGNPIGISEADSTTEQCTLLIEQSHMLAAELGIILREDDENQD